MMSGIMCFREVFSTMNIFCSWMLWPQKGAGTENIVSLPSF